MSFHHLVHPHPFRPLADLSKFFVVTPISNPVRYSRRYELYWRFKEMCDAAQVTLITVESQLGLRPFMVTESNNPLHLQINAYDEFWEKENLINIGFRRAVELGARELAWIDADVRPAMTPRDWFEETWHQLQVHKFVQMFEQACYLDYRHNASNEPRPSFIANFYKYGTPTPWIAHGITGYRGGPLWGGPGLAWAARVESLMHVGGLIDYSIQGDADLQMAHGLLGTMALSINENIKLCAPSYVRRLYQWQKLADRWIKHDVGIVPGMILHDYHGDPINRQYTTRGEMLADAKYDPDTDLKYGIDGRIRLETWEDRQILLRDRLRVYFRSRNEDAIG